MNFKVLVKKNGHVFSIKLGDELHDIERQLGKPDGLISKYGKKGYTAIEYFKLKLRLFFHPKLNTLELIRFSSKNISISSIRAIEQTISTVKKQFSDANENWDEDKYQFITIHLNETLGLTLFEEYGKITDVEYGGYF